MWVRSLRTKKRLSGTSVEGLDHILPTPTYRPWAAEEPAWDKKDYKVDDRILASVGIVASPLSPTHWIAKVRAFITPERIRMFENKRKKWESRRFVEIDSSLVDD